MPTLFKMNENNNVKTYHSVYVIKYFIIHHTNSAF